MPRLLIFAETHWLAILLLVAAGALVWRKWYWAAGYALIFAVGGLLLTDAKLTLGDNPSHVPPWLVGLAVLALFLAAVWLAFTKGWSFRLAASLAALGAFGLGGWLEADLGAGLMEV